MARLNPQPVSAPAPVDQSDSATSDSHSVDGSDKENYGATSRHHNKRKSSSITMPTPEPPPTQKRRKVDDHRQSQATQSIRKKAVDKRVDKRFYDPDQPQEERRAIKKSLRDLQAELNDSKTEYLAADSRGLVDTLRQADRLFNNVKQTSDATVDSRLLVSAADLSYKKVNTLTLGDSSVGVDVDDFITRCITFMKRADGPIDGDRSTHAAPGSTQTQRRRRQQADDDEEETGDTYNWEYLGRNACLPYNSRPCLSGFLLGPLSVQKKQRQQTQRRAREAREEPSQAVRLTQLRDEDLEKQESANLTVICSEISHLLHRVQTRGQDAVQAVFDDLDQDSPTIDDQVYAMMRRHHVASDGGVPFLDFCINPKSFGQTVENIFYVSFLIKEGKAGLNFDDRGMPTLFAQSGERSLAARQEMQRNQAVIALSFEMWEAIIRDAGITKGIIPHRKAEVHEDGRIDTQPQAGSTNDDEEEDDDLYS